LDSKHEIVASNYNLPIRFFFSNDKKPSRVLPHFHDDIEIIYLLTGQIKVTLNSIESTIYPGDVLLINPNIVHSISSDDLATSAYVLQISYGFLIKCLSDATNTKEQNISFNIPLASKNPIPCSCEIPLEELKKHLTRMNHYFWPPSDFISIKLAGIVYELTYILIKYFRVSEQEDCTRKFETFKRLYTITSYIGDHYSEVITLNELAALINFSTCYLSRLFRCTMGMTISDYITLIRLEHSFFDVISTTDPVMLISEKNGFANYNFFNKKFKEKYGNTPLKLRQSFKNSGIIIQ